MKKEKNSVEDYFCPNCRAKNKYGFNETSHADKIYDDKVSRVGLWSQTKSRKVQVINITTKVFKECTSCGGYRTLHSENSVEVPKKERDRLLGKGDERFAFN